LKRFGHIHCDITLSFLMDCAGRYVFHELCLPWHSVYHSMPPSPKCNNVRDPYELPDFWSPNSPHRCTLHYKIWGSESTRKTAQDVNDLRWHLMYVWVGVKQRYWRWHWPVAHTSPTLHACISNQKRTFWMVTVTKISQHSINCNTLS